MAASKFFGQLNRNNLTWKATQHIPSGPVAVSIPRRSRPAYILVRDTAARKAQPSSWRQISSNFVKIRLRPIRSLHVRCCPLRQTINRKSRICYIARELNTGLSKIRYVVLPRAHHTSRASRLRRRMQQPCSSFMCMFRCHQSSSDRSSSSQSPF